MPAARPVRYPRSGERAAPRAPRLTREEHHPQRVALVIDYSLEYLGGAQSAFLDAAEALSQFGHDVYIVAPGTQRSDWIVTWGGSTLGVRPKGTIPVVDLPYIPNTRALRERLTDYFDRHFIDVVHVHSEFGLAHAAVSAAHALEIPVVHTVHTFFWETRLPKMLDRAVAPMLQGALSRLTEQPPHQGPALADALADHILRAATLTLAARADLVISPSAHQAERLDAAGAGEIRVIPNTAQHSEPPGVPLQEVTVPIRLTWVGRVVHEKRILEWIEAIRLVHEERQANGLQTPLQVTVIGSGPLLRPAKRAARGLPVTFTGRLSRAEVQELMRRGHAVVLTSYGFDNQPVTIVEAVHARRGVILCDPNLIEGLQTAGIYTDAPDPSGIARTLDALIADPSPLVRASQGSEADATEFEPSHAVARLRAAYVRAAERRAALSAPTPPSP